VKTKSLYALAAVFFFAGIMQATTVQRLTLEDLVKRAHHIVSGKVRQSKTYWSSNGKLILTDYTIEVAESIKGQSSGLIQITTIGGKMGTIELHVSGMPAFQKDENVVLFTEPSGPYEVVLGLEQGKFRVENGQIFNNAGSLSFADGRPGKGVRIPVDTFKNQVRSILAR
jgi:hypothetical protein